MDDLKLKSCKACNEASETLTADKAAELKRQLNPAWAVIKNHHLERAFKFKDFKQALSFTNKVGELAEAEGHHPDIALKWGEVGITTYTHKVNGLTESDFVLAAKIDSILGA